MKNVKGTAILVLITLIVTQLCANISFADNNEPIVHLAAGIPNGTMTAWTGSSVQWNDKLNEVVSARIYGGTDGITTTAKYTFKSGKIYKITVSAGASSTNSVSVNVGDTALSMKSSNTVTSTFAIVETENFNITGSYNINVNRVNTSNNMYIEYMEIWEIGEGGGEVEEPDPGSSASPSVSPSSSPVTYQSPTPTATPTQKPVSTKKPQTGIIGDAIGTYECENMVKGGSYAGNTSTPFNGVRLYANNDNCSTSIYFAGDKTYYVEVTGAVTNSTTAKAAVYLDGAKIGTVTFTGVTPAKSYFKFKTSEMQSKNYTLKLNMEGDNGSNDLNLDKVVIYDGGALPDYPPAPVPPEKGAVETGEYRNVFHEFGKSYEEINQKLQDSFIQLFYGDDDTERVYYPVGDDMAYILDVNNNDVRSEGMSYGMMICVQMDMKTEFDRLWKWAKTYMCHTTGQFKNMFAWQCGKDGTVIDKSPAPDGEEYFVTALYFASNRWGDGEGIYNYRNEADKILDVSLHQYEYGKAQSQGGWKNIFDSTAKMVVFCPNGNGATFTDPSYHLPAFYEIWEIMAAKDNGFWNDASQVSRDFLKLAVNPTTGLNPDYASFAGVPNNTGGHDKFRFDAWRTVMNAAVDYAWWAKDKWQITYADTLQAFFKEQGEDYANQYELTGTPLSTDHSPGHVAMNATATLAASSANCWEFIDELWEIDIPVGEYRYYDGMLYMMSLLHLSGNFKAYLDKAQISGVVEDSGKISGVKIINDGKLSEKVSIFAVLYDGDKVSELTFREIDITKSPYVQIFDLQKELYTQGKKLKIYLLDGSDNIKPLTDFYKIDY